MTTADNPTDSVPARRHRVASFVTNVADIRDIVLADNESGAGYLKFGNDRGVPESCTGARKIKCIGESPPQDHPHIYINMGEGATIPCPYCGTRFRFDPGLAPLDAEPPDSLFTGAARAEPPRSSGYGEAHQKQGDRPCPEHTTSSHSTYHH